MQLGNIDGRSDANEPGTATRCGPFEGPNAFSTQFRTFGHAASRLPEESTRPRLLSNQWTSDEKKVILNNNKTAAIEVNQCYLIIQHTPSGLRR